MSLPPFSASPKLRSVPSAFTFLLALRETERVSTGSSPPTEGCGCVVGGSVHPSYNAVRSFLLASIPEFRPRYQEEIRKCGHHPKPYLAFAALNEMVTEALDFDGDPSFLAKVFDVFEKMVLSGDREVVTLLQVGFVENLVKFPKRLAAAWERMGPATQKLTADTARAWNREMNLPASARAGEKSHAKAQTAR